MKSTIRRSWDGSQYYVGTATVRYENGNIAVLSNVDGLRWNSIDPTADGNPIQYWHEDGRELDHVEWFLYMSGDYLPRRTDSEPLSTEQEWRGQADEIKKQHPEWANNASR